MYAAVPRGDVKAGVEKSVKCEQGGGAGLTRKGCGAEGQAAVGPVGAAKVGGGGHNAAAVACMISIGVVYVCTVSSDNTHGGRGGGSGKSAAPYPFSNPFENRMAAYDGESSRRISPRRAALRSERSARRTQALQRGCEEM
jgi:hypothetical protein